MPQSGPRGWPRTDLRKRVTPASATAAAKIVPGGTETVWPLTRSWMRSLMGPKVIWQDRAVLVTKTVTSPGSVTIGRTFGRAFTVVDSKEYQELRGFYQKVAAADQQQLVLTRAPAEKGN